MDTMPYFDPEEATKKITNFIKAYVKKSGTKGAVIGLSGGIDSAVTTYLAVKALGRENVLAIIMPEMSLTPPEDVLDATDMANILNIEFSVMDISETLNSFIISIIQRIQTA